MQGRPDYIYQAIFSLQMTHYYVRMYVYIIISFGLFFFLFKSFLVAAAAAETVFAVKGTERKRVKRRRAGNRKRRGRSR